VNGAEVAWDFIRESYAAVSKLSVIPFQDLFNLGSEGRLNTPGQAAGNWGWRYNQAQFERLRRKSTGYLHELGELYARL
jgi:4-alpha-glucanotransferase